MAAADAPDLGSRRQIQTLGLTVATAVGLYLCYRMVEPFIPALTWAMALAIVFMPVHRRLLAAVRLPNLAAALSVLAIAMIVVVPTMLMGQRLISEAISGAEIIRGRVESGEWQRVLDPRVAPLVEWLERQIDVSTAINSVVTWLTDATASLVTGSVVQATAMLLTFYLIFFLFRDQRQALRALRALSPLSDDQLDRLFARVGDTVYATIYGTLAMAALQGALGGLMFWWLGLPAPLLWGLMMGALAVVPVLGAFIIWVPAAIFLALDGSWGKALTLTLWGGVLVAGIDNVIYPVLVGNRLKLHTVPSFIAIVGGLIVFGTAGVILGPVTLTVTLLLLDVWRHRTSTS